MKDKFNDYYPAEDAFLTNPIVSPTEATGCSQRIREREGRTASISAPVKGAEIPAIQQIRRHKN